MLSTSRANAFNQKMFHPFEHTATGRVGCQRDTMLKNYLHLKPKLGRTRDLGYEDPYDPKQIFGCQSVAGESAAKSMVWPVVPPEGVDRPNPTLEYFRNTATNPAYGMTDRCCRTREGPPTPDFESPHIRSRKFADVFRDEKGVQLPDINDRSSFLGAGHELHTKFKGHVPDMFFGKSSGSTLPIGKLIEHQYQKEWYEGQLNKHEQCPQHLKIPRDDDVMRGGFKREHMAGRGGVCVDKCGSVKVDYGNKSDGYVEDHERFAYNPPPYVSSTRSGCCCNFQGTGNDGYIYKDGNTWCSRPCPIHCSPHKMFSPKDQIDPGNQGPYSGFS